MSQKKIKRQRLLEKKILSSSLIDYGFGLRKIITAEWKYILGILIFTVILYINSLFGDFVSDDYATIINNPTVKSLSESSKLLSLTTWSNWLLAIIFGSKNPIPFHIFNLFIYLAVLVFVYLFIRLFFEKKIAIVTGLVYSLLPIHVESVSWISGKPYLMNGLFVLLGLILLFSYLRSENQKYLKMLLITIPLIFFADKVRSFSYILLSLFTFFVFREKHWKINWNRIALVLLIIIGVSLAFLWPHIQTRITSVNSGYNQSDSIFYNPLFQYPTAITKYLQLIFVPVDLTLYHTLFNFPVELNWLITLSYFSSLVYFWFKDKRIFYSLGFIFLATLPSMSPVKVSWLVAERYMFLGSLGGALLFAIIWSEIGKKSKYVSWVLLTIVLLIYSIRVVLRNDDWSTNHKLWVNTVYVSWNSHNAWNNIGDDYDKKGDFENAIKGFSQSTQVKPNYADAYHNRANILYKIGRLDLARDSYLKALSFQPGLYQSYISLIQIDMAEKRFDQALQHAKKAVTVDPNNPQSRYVLGVILVQTGNLLEGEKELKNSLLLNPGFKPAIDALNQIETIKNEKNSINKPTE